MNNKSWVGAVLIGLVIVAIFLFVRASSRQECRDKVQYLPPDRGLFTTLGKPREVGEYRINGMSGVYGSFDEAMEYCMSK